MQGGLPMSHEHKRIRYPTHRSAHPQGRSGSLHDRTRGVHDFQSHGSHADCWRALPVLVVSAEAPLVNTPCCEQWIGCDTALLSFQGGGYCQGEHERLRLCYAHDQDQHGGPWESCQKCRDFWSPQDSKFYAEHPN